MKSFRQFLFEQYDVEDHPDGFVNHAHINGNHIITKIRRNGPPGHYAISFTRNELYTHPEHDPSGHRVGIHVGKVLKNFIEKHQPKELLYTHTNDHHMGPFKLAAQAISKKYGYNHFDAGMGHILTKP